MPALSSMSEGTPNKRCLLAVAPLPPFYSKNRKKKDLLFHRITIFIAHSCVLPPPSLLPTCLVPHSLEAPVTPPTPPPTHCSAGIKEIGGVELLSWIRHGQCSLDWTKPPEGKTGRGWIGWEYGGNMHPWSGCLCLSPCCETGWICCLD